MAIIIFFTFASLSTFLKLWWLAGARTLSLNPMISFFDFGIVTNLMNLNLLTNTTKRQLILVYNWSFTHISWTKLYHVEQMMNKWWNIFPIYYTILLLIYPIIIITTMKYYWVFKIKTWPRHSFIHMEDRTRTPILVLFN